MKILSKMLNKKKTFKFFAKMPKHLTTFPLNFCNHYHTSFTEGVTFLFYPYPILSPYPKKVSFMGKGETFKMSLPYIRSPVKSIKGKGGNVKMHFGINFIFIVFWAMQFLMY
jgi:hypothetical protein